ATTPDYLVNRFAFSYVYSVNRMLIDPPGTTTDGRFVGMAPEQFVGTKLPPLPGSGESLKRVGDHFFWPTLLTGLTATRSKFRELAPRASVVQLFTHADTLQREPVLYFADSLLRLSELQTGPVFQPQLVVLSARRTGVGSHQNGEGVFSLARGFAALGVSSMLTTLWSVDSRSTYTLTELFYAGLAAGLDKDIALQRAKQEWLRTASRSQQLPSTWAGLILIGDSQPLRQSGLTLTESVCWIGGGLIGLLGVIWFIRRGRGQAIKAVTTQSVNWKPSLN
ncbi:MAG: CHAT domain-containing protein, partial [Rudanella sp.]|nr:CHAT domain-containing protein [Rudanella sp.]